jgi:hypothetical protein
MLAFHDEARRVARPTTWELRLTDGEFTSRANGTNLTLTAGAPDAAVLESPVRVPRKVEGVGHSNAGMIRTEEGT